MEEAGRARATILDMVELFKSKGFTGSNPYKNTANQTETYFMTRPVGARPNP